MKFASVFKLIFSDGATLRKQKLVFRHCLHHYISRLAHRGHIAIEKSKTGLRSKVQWSHIDFEASSSISECHSCQTTVDHHILALMIPTSMAESLWLSVAVDLCVPIPTGETFLVLVDYFYRFPFVQLLQTLFLNYLKSDQCMVYQKY